MGVRRINFKSDTSVHESGAAVDIDTVNHLPLMTPVTDHMTKFTVTFYETILKFTIYRR